MSIAHGVAGLMVGWSIAYIRRLRRERADLKTQLWKASRERESAKALVVMMQMKRNLNAVRKIDVMCMN